MKNVFFSIDALMVLNGENIRGILNIDTQRLKFVSNESVLLDKSVNWEKLEHTIKKEIVRKFFLFSTTYYLITFTENGISLPCFQVDEKHGEVVSHAIDNIKKVFIEQKEYQLKLEEERRREAERLEAERQRKLEEERLKEAERLEAECQRKSEEERLKEVERLEAELQRKLEEKYRKEAEGVREADRLNEARAIFAHTIASSLKKTEWKLVLILDQFAKKRENYEKLKEKEYERECEQKQLKEAERLETERRRKRDEERREKSEEERLKESESQRIELQKKYEDALLLEVGRLESEHQKEEKRQNKIKEELRKEAERLEAERQRKLEEEHRKEAERLEQERQRRKEKRRKEVERLGRERQRKLEEERRREAERLEQERQRKLEEERRHEAERLEHARQKKLEEERRRETELLEQERQRKLEEDRRREAERLEQERQRKLEEEKRLEAEQFEQERQKRLEKRRKEVERLGQERQKKYEEERRREAERLEQERQRKLEEEKRLEAERLEKERQKKLEEERRRETERLEQERQRKLEEERRREAERLEKERQRKFEEEKNRDNHQKLVNIPKQQKKSIKSNNCNIEDYYDYESFLHYQNTVIDSNIWIDSFSKFIQQYCEYCYDGRGIVIARKAQTLLLAFYAAKNRVIKHDVLEYEYEDFISEYYSVRADSEVEYIVENIINNALYLNEYNERLLAKTLEIILTDFHEGLIYRSDYDDAESYNYRQIQSSYSYKWNGNKSRDTLSTLYAELYDYELEEDVIRDINSIASEKASAIVDFIRKQKKPVSIGQISKQFLSLKKRTVMKVLEDSDEIINYRGKYYSSLQLKISPIEKETIKEEIDHYLDTEVISHIEGIYDFLRPDYGRVLSKMFVNNSYELFSVISVLYKEDFVFKRPFITFPGYAIPTTQEWLEAYINNYNEIPLENVLSYAKEKYLKIPNITDFILSVSGTTVLKNKYTFTKRQLIGVNESIIQNVDSLIYNELISTTSVKAIRDLSCIVKLPQIALPWNEWLIFTVLLVGKRKTKLSTTSNKYKNAIPVVSIKTYVDTNVLEQIADRYSGYEEQDTDVQIDDLGNLDSLIEDDISLDDIEDIDFDFDDYDEDEE